MPGGPAQLGNRDATPGRRRSSPSRVGVLTLRKDKRRGTDPVEPRKRDIRAYYRLGRWRRSHGRVLERRPHGRTSATRPRTRLAQRMSDSHTRTRRSGSIATACNWQPDRRRIPCHRPQGTRLHVVRAAVFSDVHRNLVALDAVLSAAAVTTSTSTGSSATTLLTALSRRKSSIASSSSNQFVQYGATPTDTFLTAAAPA